MLQIMLGNYGHDHESQSYDAVVQASLIGHHDYLETLQFHLTKNSHF